MSDVLPTAPGGAEQPACPGCGAPAVAGAAFCHRCGHPLGAEAPAHADPATTPAPSVFDAPPAAVPTLPPPLAPPAAGDPPRGTTLPGWGSPASAPARPAPRPASPPPAHGGPPPAWPYAAPPPGQGPSPYPGAHQPPPSRVGLVLLVVGGGALVLLAVVGILAAIAIPNFLRYQLRAKASEVPVLLGQLDRAEVALREQGESYVVFADGLPAEQEPGRTRLRWTGDDLEVVSALGWQPGEGTWARYAVDGQEDEDGHQAISLCAEADLDGDGVLAGWVVFRPALAEDGSMIVPPPPAPCGAAVALEEGRTLEFDPAVPPGAVVRVSPDGVF